MNATPAEIVGFWVEAGPAAWFTRDDSFDAEIRRRFGPSAEAAAAGAHDAFAKTREGALALLLLLDQFPRNLHRGSGRAFAADPKARAIADAAIASGFDLATPARLRPFFYLPLMHSERLADQERCMALCLAYCAPDNYKYAVIHRDVIARFGRFPHRNAALGRETSDDEREFLASGGFSA